MNHVSLLARAKETSLFPGTTTPVFQKALAKENPVIHAPDPSANTGITRAIPATERGTLQMLAKQTSGNSQSRTPKNLHKIQ